MAKIIDNYILIEGIGQGTFGEIHKGRNLISKEAVAVKTIKLERFLNDTILRDMIINEIQALKKLEDSSIVRMIKMLKSANNIYLVYEFLNGGSLENHLKERGKLSEQEARVILLGVLKGFKTLHHEKIIHRNINLNNLFFNEGVVKIKNFFCCKSPTSQKTFDPENFLYAAPEILLKTQQPQYEDKCDIFSLGLVFYKIIYGQLPFNENYTQEQLIDYYKTTNEFRMNLSDLTDQTASLLQGMLIIDQSKRFEWQTLFHEEQAKVPGSQVMSNSTNNQNFSSNYQINSQVQQFDTIGHNFYISQQSVNNHVNTSPNELLKRRTTITDKENNNPIANSKKESDYVLQQQQQFTKTIEKESATKQIQTQLYELRYQFNVIMTAIAKVELMESWMAKIKADICLQFLLKKALKILNQMAEVCQNQDRIWQQSRIKSDIVKNLNKDIDEISNQFKIMKTNNSCVHEELNTQEIIDEQYIDNVLVMIAKQISIESGQVRSSMRSNSQIKNHEQQSQRNGSFVDTKTVNPIHLQFAVFLIDLVKGIDEPKTYFKRLEESRASDLLEQRLKII